MRISIKGTTLAIILLTVIIACSCTAWAGMLKMPITFIENRNIIDNNAKFFIRTPQASASFNKSSIDFINNKGSVHMQFADASDSIKLSGLEKLDGKINVLHGRDTSKWQKEISTYKTIQYSNVWNGIDINFTGQGSSLKYDILVAPQSDLSNIKVQVADAKKLWIDKSGSLHIETNTMQLTENIPASYQMINGCKTPVKVSYRIYNATTYGFSVKNYNPKYSLVIDPVNYLKWSSLIGGDLSEDINGLAVDASGAVYVCGWTNSSFNFPTTPGAYKNDKSHVCNECFIAKIDPNGNKMIYCTFLGGPGNDAFGRPLQFPGSCIAVDSSGKAYVTGYTDSVDFPVTDNAYKKQLTGYKDIFVTKLNENGSALEYSTLIGGSSEEYSNGIALDGSNNIYIVGGTSSSDYPTTDGVVQPSLKTKDTRYQDVFVTKFNADYSGLSYSTFLGGEDSDTGNCITVDADGNAFIGGGSKGDGFPTTSNSHLPKWGNSYSGFLAKLNVDASLVVFGTYVDGEVYSATLGPDNVVYICAATKSDSVETTSTAVQKTLGGLYDGFLASYDGIIASYDPWNGALKYSTYLGGSKVDVPYCVSVDSNGYIYAGGYTTSADFPTTDNAYSSWFNGGYCDGFFVKIDKDSGMQYSSYFGGSDLDYINLVKATSSGYLYIAGNTSSTKSFPVLPAASQTKPYSGQDGFVAKFRVQSMPIVTIATPSNLPNLYTKVNIATISGTSNAAKITYETSNGESGDCTVTNPEFSFNFQTPQFNLKAGRNIITITATDNQSNTDTDSIAIYVDNTAPTVVITEPDTEASTAYFGSATILGTSKDDNAVDSVYCSNNGGNLIKCTGISPWQTELPLTRGDNNITTYAYDEAGNVGTKTIKITYNPPDIEKPQINILSPTGNDEYLSSAATIDISGFASDNSELTFINWSVSGGASGQITNPSANWSISSIPLTLGYNIITVTAVDESLNNASDTLTVTYDGPGPNITINTPTTEPVYLDNTGIISLAGAAEQGVTKLTWENSTGGKGVCKGTTSWTASKISLVPGNNIIKITGTNKAGKKGFDTLLVTYNDVTSPLVKITSPSSKDQYSTTKATLILGGTASDNKNIKKVSWSNAATGASGDCLGRKSWKSPAFTPKLGANEITVTAEDMSGNKSTDVIVITRQDKVKPKVAITTPTTKSSYNYDRPSIQLSGVSSDDIEVSKVEWLNKSTGISGVCTGTSTWISTSIAHQVVKTIALQIGKNNIVITSSDSSNNKATDTISVVRKK